MVRRGVEPLVAPGTAEVGLEDLESVVVLLLARVGLAEPLLEERELVLGSQPDLAFVVDDLPDQNIAVRVAGDRLRRGGVAEEERECDEEEERESPVHFRERTRERREEERE